MDLVEKVMKSLDSIIWLKIGPSDGVLWIRLWAFGFHKRWEICKLSERLSPSQEPFWSKERIRYFVEETSLRTSRLRRGIRLWGWEVARTSSGQLWHWWRWTAELCCHNVTYVVVSSWPRTRSKVVLNSQVSGRNNTSEFTTEQTSQLCVTKIIYEPINQTVATYSRQTRRWSPQRMRGMW
jgi:hypothetical protein